MMRLFRALSSTGRRQRAVAATTRVLVEQLDALEQSVCIHLNRADQHKLVHAVLVAASRLGDGPFWYALIAAIALAGGPEGPAIAARMVAAGAAGLLVHRLLKGRLMRERPFMRHSAVSCLVAPLDRYSFPSGHTLHAVLFTTLLVALNPVMACLVAPFTLAVAASRIVLGLHYPSDVLFGAAIGWALAQLSLALWPL